MAPNRLLLILLAAVTLLPTPGCRKDQPAPRPHILFAIADDWGWPHAGAYGDPVVRTPAFDRVAGEGILFNHAYISSPSCTPSRNAVLTGQFHWRLGPGANLWSTLDTAIPVYPLILEDAGYKTGRYRKSWGPGDISNWERHPAGRDYTGEGFSGFLDALPEGTPFCFWLGTSDPHRPFERGSGKASGMDPGQIDLFGCFPDHETVRMDVADYYYEVQRFDTLVAGAIRLLEEKGMLENTIIVVTGDHGMPFPRCKSNNYDSGARVPLAIRWGSRIQDPGRVLDDFVSLTDLAPTFLAAAGVEVPEQMTGQSLLDLFTTSGEGFVDRDGRGYVMHGKERHVPGQEDHMGGYPVRALRNHEFLYIRNFEPDRWPAGTPNYREAAVPCAWLADCDNGPTKFYMWEHRNLDSLHRRLYDLAFGKRPPEELYDCRNDPDQLVNLAFDPAYAEIREELSSLLMEQLEATGDPRAFGAGHVFDEYPYPGGAPTYPGCRAEQH